MKLERILLLTALLVLGPGVSAQQDAVDLSQQVDELVYRAVKRPNDSLAQLNAYVGTYYSEELDATYTLLLDVNKLAAGRKREMSLFYGPNSPMFSGTAIEVSASGFCGDRTAALRDFCLTPAA